MLLNLKYKPDPILISPLCWMKIVSHVKFPWTIGGEQECKKLTEPNWLLSNHSMKIVNMENTLELTIFACTIFSKLEGEAS